MKYHKLLFMTGGIKYLIMAKENGYEIGYPIGDKIDENKYIYNDYTDERIASCLRNGWAALKRGHTICNGCDHTL